MSYGDIVGNMHFTDEETKILLEQRDKIVEWCMKNIVPRIPSGEYVSVDFGDIYRAPDSWETTTDYHFCVWSGPTRFYSYPTEGVEGCIGVGERFGGCGNAFHLIKYPRVIFPVVDNWKKIKTELLVKVCEMESRHEKIRSFEV